ncbi:hypothetical protein ABIE20_004012 [Pseudomonas sp. 2835]
MPAIECAALAIQPPPEVLTAPASSPARPHNGSAYTGPGGSWPCRRSSAQRSQSSHHLRCWLHRPHRRQGRLPQMWTACTRPVGAGLACDRVRSARNPATTSCAGCTGLIAGKAGSHKCGLHVPNLWELALPAIERAAVVIQSTPLVLAAPASSPARPAPTNVDCMYQTCGSRPCLRSSAQRSQSSHHLRCWLHRPHRRQGRLPQMWTACTKPVGAGLAGDRARSGRNPVNTSCAGCTGLIAGKAGPTIDLHVPNLWEQALPAIECAALAIQPPPEVLAAPASSPARPAPSEVVHAGPFLPGHNHCADFVIGAT